MGGPVALSYWNTGWAGRRFGWLKRRIFSLCGYGKAIARCSGRHEDRSEKRVKTFSGGLLAGNRGRRYLQERRGRRQTMYGVVENSAADVLRQAPGRETSLPEATGSTEVAADGVRAGSKRGRTRPPTGFRKEKHLTESSKIAGNDDGRYAGRPFVLQDRTLRICR